MGQRFRFSCGRGYANRAAALPRHERSDLWPGEAAPVPERCAAPKIQHPLGRRKSPQTNRKALARTLGVELGVYKHAVGSLHMYEEHVSGARKYSGLTLALHYIR